MSRLGASSGDQWKMTESQAIAKARQAIAGKITPQDGAPVQILRVDGNYVVTFVHVNPVGTRGPDFEARVHIDAETGEVVGLLAGS
jgi:hypothetical protein